MQVILISKVKNLGDVGAVVDVKNGYARNFLIPQKKAINYSASNYKSFEEQRKHFEAENAQNTSAAEKIKNKLAGQDVIIVENASDDGRLYGSVHAGVIANKINDLISEKAISRLNILLRKPIKEIGIYTATVNLYSDIAIDVRLIVTRSESEIKALLENQKKAARKSEESAAEEAAPAKAESKKNQEKSAEAAA